MAEKVEVLRASSEEVENSKAMHGGLNVEFQQIDPTEERKLVRKLDLVVIPLMACVYFFQCLSFSKSSFGSDPDYIQDLDKQSINYAAVFGLKSDLKLTGDEFSWVISLFYFGQLCSEYPAIYLMSRLPLTVYVGVTIVIWGGLEMCLGAAQNFHGLAAARFFLGFAEGTVSPAFIIITSIWYKRREHPIRVAAWVSMSGVSQIVGALIMYGIGGADIKLENWRAMFLICGGLTSLCGIVFIVLMPRNTTNAWFLTERQREIATHRLALDRATRDRAEFDKGQVKEALAEPLTWVYILMALCITLTTPILKVRMM